MTSSEPSAVVPSWWTAPLSSASRACVYPRSTGLSELMCASATSAYRRRFAITVSFAPGCGIANTEPGGNPGLSPFSVSDGPFAGSISASTACTNEFPRVRCSSWISGARCIGKWRSSSATSWVVPLRCRSARSWTSGLPPLPAVSRLSCPAVSGWVSCAPPIR
jgi:hypothetical protein